MPEGNLVGLYDIDLVGGIPTHLKNMSSSVGIIVPNIWTNNKCLKPPTSDDCFLFMGIAIGITWGDNLWLVVELNHLEK